MNRFRYVVMKLVHWDNFEARALPLSPGVAIVGPYEGCPGFMPVFDSDAAARAAFPGAVIMPIQEGVDAG